METRDFQTQSENVPYPSIPPLIDSRETEYRGTGITSSVAIFGHPIHPIIVIFPIAFLSGVNFFLRLGNPVTIILPVGLIISLIVSILLLASGWYGGELMFRHKVGIVGPGETHVS